MTVGPNGPGLTPGRPAPTMTAGEKRPPGAPGRFYFLPAKISGKPQAKTGGHNIYSHGSARRSAQRRPDQGRRPAQTPRGI